MKKQVVNLDGTPVPGLFRNEDGSLSNENMSELDKLRRQSENLGELNTVIEDLKKQVLFLSELIQNGNRTNLPS